MARSPRIRAFLWMLGSGIFFIMVTIIVRYLGSGLPAVEAAFIRYAFGIVFLLPFLLRTLKETPVPRRLGLHAIRGVVHATGVMLWFYAMARIPIVEVTAIGFVAPIFTTIGAAIFLGEKLRARRITAVVCGFIGALIILRPGFQVIEIGAWAQLVATPLFAASFIIAKKLTETESGTSIVAWMSIFVTLALLPPSLFVWVTPSMEELFWLALTAACATIGHTMLMRAIALAELTVLQPFSFLQLVWASIFGLLLFGEVPDVWTIVGGGVIIGAATYIAHRESVVRRKAS